MKMRHTVGGDGHMTVGGTQTVMSEQASKHVFMPVHQVDVKVMTTPHSTFKKKISIAHGRMAVSQDASPIHTRVITHTMGKELFDKAYLDPKPN